MFQSTQKSFLNYFRGWDAPNIVNECINTIHKSNKYTRIIIVIQLQKVKSSKHFISKKEILRQLVASKHCTCTSKLHVI